MEPRTLFSTGGKLVLHFGYSDMVEAIQYPVDAASEQFASELEAPRWSVISFECREGNSLSYSDAIRLLDDLDRKGVAGLCIVSDEAAACVST